MSTTHQADVVIAGGGLAGLAAAHELIDRGLRVLVLDRDREDRLGGLAKRSFGGVMFVDTPHQRKLELAKQVLFGNKELVNRLIDDCEDFVVADTLPELMDKMEALSLDGAAIDREGMAADIAAYDAQIARGPRYFNDDQLRRIATSRTYRADKLRTCAFQAIDDRKARPLIAIREFILSRKSLGGLQTDLGSRVLDCSGEPIPGLYAIGETAGFGGGGIHGKGSLEGTFLGSCVLTGRLAARAITGMGG